MTTPTQVRLELKEQEVERLSADFKRRISELQLTILSGSLNTSELAVASEQLAVLRKQVAVNMEVVLKEQTGRRVRTAEENRQRIA